MWHLSRAAPVVYAGTGCAEGRKRDFVRCRSRQLAPILGCRVMQFVVTILETTGKYKVKGAPSCPQCDLRFRH